MNMDDKLIEFDDNVDVLNKKYSNKTTKEYVYELENIRKEAFTLMFHTSIIQSIPYGKEVSEMILKTILAIIDEDATFDDIYFEYQSMTEQFYYVFESEGIANLLSDQTITEKEATDFVKEWVDSLGENFFASLY